MNSPPTETCCVCGSESVTYHNYRDQPFCGPCADGPTQPSALDRILADAAHHEACAAQSQTDEGAISHSSIAAGLRIAARHLQGQSKETIVTDQPEGRAMTTAEFNAERRARRRSKACSEQHTYEPPCQARVTQPDTPAGQSAPAECPDACTEHHTYGPDCAAIRDDYDPNVGMRERYAEALYQAGETKAFAPYLDREQAGELADAVLAARDVYLNNVRRISREQTTQLAELYMATKKRAEEAETLADDLRERLRVTGEACFTATLATQDAEAAISRVRDVIHDMERTTGARTWAGWLATALESPKETS
ncbi:hypothetical protein [Streptomyces sp. cmx-4-9]|uniref:hypothetical protein n=1 Tax=Streptomyces sp. cmx-4-9 TaxID=2790941 RepID=UPI00397E985B